MQCVMQCMIVYEWNVWAFFEFFFSFSSFLVLTNAECKCHMRMPWLDLPMRYATNVPLYAIDRLLTTGLDVNLLWMQTKCDASLDFLFPMLMLLDEDANAIFYLRWKCPMQGWKCKVYSWWCQRTYLIEMQMSFCRDGDANVLRCKCLLMGMSWCKCFL